MKRLAIYVAIIAVTVAALILLWQFRSVLILLLLSLMLASALRPTADSLTARGLPVSLSWLLVYLGLLALVGLSLWVSFHGTMCAASTAVRPPGVTMRRPQQAQRWL